MGGDDVRVDVKSYRMKRGLSQAELSRKSGVPQPMISEIESGVAQYPQINTLYKLSRALRCSVDDFIVPDDEPAAAV